MRIVSCGCVVASMVVGLCSQRTVAVVRPTSTEALAKAVETPDSVLLHFLSLSLATRTDKRAISELETCDGAFGHEESRWIADFRILRIHQVADTAVAVA